MFQEFYGVLLADTYDAIFGHAVSTANFSPLDNLFTQIANSGWRLTFIIGSFCAVVELLLVGVHLYMNAANPNARAESKRRFAKIVIVTVIMVSLVSIVSLIERTVGLDM